MSEITPIREKWKSSMTDRERFNKQMQYQPVDRCFNMEFGWWNENFKIWKMFTDNNITNNNEGDAFFNFDKTATISGNIWLNPSFAGEVISETADKKIVLDHNGVQAEVPKDGHETIPHYIKSSIEEPEDWEKVKAERLRRDDPARKVDIEALKKLHPEDRTYPLGVWTGSMIGTIRDTLTFEGLAFACMDYPEMVEDMVETSCLLVEDQLDQLLPHFNFDYAAGWEDICFKNGPIVTPDFFRDVVMPRYKRINKKLKAHNIDLWWTDCDGDVRPILKYFLEGGINCLFPFEVNGCAHPGELLDQYEGQLRIMGGFDKMEMAKGKDEIKKYMQSLAPYVERGGYIPFCDHRCPPDVSEENYNYYLDLKEEMFGMK